MLLNVEIPRDGRASVLARQAVASWLDGRVSSRAAADVALVVSELVTNALLHGHGTITLHARLASDGQITGHVSDEGGGFRPTPPPPERALSPGGRGLVIVHALTRSWWIQPGQSLVTFELDTGAGAGGRRGGQGRSD